MIKYYKIIFLFKSNLLNFAVLGPYSKKNKQIFDKYHLQRLKYANYRLAMKTKSFVLINQANINLVFKSNLINFAV